MAEKRTINMSQKRPLSHRNYEDCSCKENKTKRNCKIAECNRAAHSSTNGGILPKRDLLRGEKPTELQPNIN